MPAGTAVVEKGERHILHTSGFSTIDGPDGEERVYYFGDDKQGWNFRAEVRRTIADLVRGNEPTTILGILIKQPQAEESVGQKPIVMEELAQKAGRTVAATEAIVDYLMEEELAVTIDEDGIEQVIGCALYTPKNDVELPASNERIPPRTF